MYKEQCGLIFGMHTLHSSALVICVYFSVAPVAMDLTDDKEPQGDKLSAVHGHFFCLHLVLISLPIISFLTWLRRDQRISSDVLVI